MNRYIPTTLATLLLLAALPAAQAEESAGSVEPLPGERHFRNLRQLTFGGQNAEAYFSHDGKELIFQSTRDDMQCDAIFRMRADGSHVRRVSPGQGVTTCAFIAPDNLSIIYASTHLQQQQCPPRPDYSKGYVWPLHADYEIFSAGPEGQQPKNISNSDNYDAEAVYSPLGDRIVFTSLRSGDLELYLMNPDGSDVQQLTDTPGYDGGAFFSLDGQSIVWRASRPQGEALAEYRALLKEGLIRPNRLELFSMNLKDRIPVQLTDNGAANFGPYWHPDGRHIIFSSNMHDPKGRNFDLYMIDTDSREIERITYYEGFDGFPMFSHDGSRLVFASNRNGRVSGETNVFIADFINYLP